MIVMKIFNSIHESIIREFWRQVIENIDGDSFRSAENSYIDSGYSDIEALIIAYGEKHDDISLVFDKLALKHGKKRFAIAIKNTLFAKAIYAEYEKSHKKYCQKDKSIIDHLNAVILMLLITGKSNIRDIVEMPDIVSLSLRYIDSLWPEVTYVLANDIMNKQRIAKCICKWIIHKDEKRKKAAKQLLYSALFDKQMKNIIRQEAISVAKKHKNKYRLFFFYLKIKILNITDVLRIIL